MLDNASVSRDSFYILVIVKIKIKTGKNRHGMGKIKIAATKINKNHGRKNIRLRRKGIKYANKKRYITRK